ncbi:MAG: DUF1579 family protein [Chloracidobacterium sp.]|nr:DUF1579 family protein [Chloracidobacterium sp.]
MSIQSEFEGHAGRWHGTNILYLSGPEGPKKLSPSDLTVSFKANGQFVAFDYTWEYEGELQEGFLVLGSDERSDAVQAVWTDSWHNRNVLMLCDGKKAPEGTFSVKGFYKVEGHPDWGWRTEIIPGDGTLRIGMYNVSPEGEEELAVETDLTRP